MHYRVQITNHGESSFVFAYMPEQFNLGVSGDWEPLLANMISNIPGASSAMNFGRLLGAVPYDKMLTGQVWRSSEPLSFNLNLQFDAETNAEKDVTEPVQKLISWALPIRDSEGGFLLKPPGPTIFDQTNRMSMRIGRFMYLDNVIFPNVDVTWYTAPDGKGQYIAADVALTVRTFFTPDRKDIMDYFGRATTGDDSAIYNPSDEARSRVDSIRRFFGG